MSLTDQERFEFDLAGFFIRPAILTRDEVEMVTEQIRRIHHDPTSLPPQHRAMPGGPASMLIDHPKVVDVLHDVIGPDVRLESTFSLWRQKGESHGQGLHQGGPMQADPIFGYRVQNGRIYAGLVRVIFELTDVDECDGATVFLAGSHKASFDIHPSHLSLEDGKRSAMLRSYSCPAGSAIFFTENLCHAGPAWRRDTPRIAVLNAYAHLGTYFGRLPVPEEVMAALPRDKQAWFRDVWMYEFGHDRPVKNSIQRFVASAEAPVNIRRSQVRADGI